MGKYLTLVVLSIVLFSNVLSADDAAKPDPRLDAKVTIDCVNVRLYTALDRISAQTKVAVRAGKNANDWQVRDMPVLVCARDIPLGKLLQGIADATHLLLSDSPVDNVSAYRIWRDAKREKKINDFEKSRKAAARAAASNDWDALSAVKDIPDDRFEGKPLPDSLLAMTRAMSNVVSRLGPDARDQVLNGEKLVLGQANVPDSLRPYLMACYQSFYDWIAKSANAQNDSPLKPLEEMLSCYVKIQFGRSVEYPATLCPAICLDGRLTHIDPGYYQHWVQKYVPKVPPRPRVPDPKLIQDDIDRRYKKLVLDKDGPGFLDTKLKLDPPSPEQKRTYSDLLCAVSKATGYSIVAEGSAARYVKFVMTLDKELETMLASKEITVRDALTFGTDYNREVWYLDEADKVILGRDAEWIEAVKSLVPEKLLKETSAKLNGKGMDLDDLEPFVGLTKEQSRAWIMHCSEYPEIEAKYYPLGSISYDSSLWAFYFALDQSDRATARSGKLVELGGLDPAWRCFIMRQYVRRDVEMRYMNARVIKDPPTMDAAEFTNPDSAPSLSLWVEKMELPDAKGKDLYIVHLKSQKDGSAQEFKESLDTLFPMFAPGKDTVLEKLREKKQSPGNG